MNRIDFENEVECPYCHKKQDNIDLEVDEKGNIAMQTILCMHCELYYVVEGYIRTDLDLHRIEGQYKTA